LWDAASGILVLLALGLAFRLIIAYLLPGSGFKNDIEAFGFWASNLADKGLYGFYERDFFHDYTPGYLTSCGSSAASRTSSGTVSAT
jgi:hypothetical protein